MQSDFSVLRESIGGDAPYQLLSLGGSATYEVAKRVRPTFGTHSAHLWRRPTIALMSDPASHSRFKYEIIPRDFVNYFVNDLMKSHLRQIDLQTNKEVLLADITRDIFTGVVQLDSDCFVMDPVDGIDIVDGLDADNMSEEILFDLLGGTHKRYSFEREPEEFFAIWTHYFDQFCTWALQRFREVVISSFYFTNKCNSTPYRHDFAVERCARANAMLERMYKHARGKNIRFLDVDSSYLITGNDVPWGGPFPKHYLPETYELYAELLSGSSCVTIDNMSGAGFVRQAFCRAQQVDELKSVLADAIHALVYVGQELKRSQVKLSLVSKVVGAVLPPRYELNGLLSASLTAAVREVAPASLLQLEQLCSLKGGGSIDLCCSDASSIDLPVQSSVEHHSQSVLADDGRLTTKCVGRVSELDEALAILSSEFKDITDAQHAETRELVWAQIRLLESVGGRLP